MIAKQKIGSGFRGVLDYLRHGSGGKQRERGEVLDTNLPATDHSPRAFARSFGAFRHLNDKLGKAVYHVSLSPAPGDEISDEQWREIARLYLAGMGFEDCGFVLIKHDEEADDGDAVRPPHVHLLACRIRPDGSTVSDQNNYRRSEKVVREIEAKFGLVQLAAPTPKQRKTKEEAPMNDKLNAYAKTRLEAAAEDAEDKLGITIEPAAVCAAEPAEALSDRERKDYKREILEMEYQAIIRDAFADTVRFVRPGRGGLTVHFKNGGRVVDSGDRVAAYGMAARPSAEALIELAILKGWPSIVLTGSDEFLREAFGVALAKGLTVQPKPDQIEIFMRVKNQRDGKSNQAITGAASPGVIPPPVQRKVADLRTLTGLKGIGQRLTNRQDSDSSSGTDSAPRPFRP